MIMNLTSVKKIYIYMSLLQYAITFFDLWGTVLSATVVLPECEHPDVPWFGGYAPTQDSYNAGDVIYYHCDVDTYLTGQSKRMCEDTGHWSGDTPYCDSPEEFVLVNQTSTAEDADENSADQATDSDRRTCSLTGSEPGAMWTGFFGGVREIKGVNVFAAKGDVAYEVFMIIQDGGRISCGKRHEIVERLAWHFHECPTPYNREGVAIQIKSLSDQPLQLCEIGAHAFLLPTCTDPRIGIQNGFLKISRNKATLVCDFEYIRGYDTSVECVRTNVWNRKDLYCIDLKRNVVSACCGQRGKNFWALLAISLTISFGLFC